MGDYNFKSKANSLNSKFVAMKNIQLDGNDQYYILKGLMIKFYPIINMSRFSSVNSDFTPLNENNLSKDKLRFKSTFVVTLTDNLTDYEFDVRFDFEVALKGFKGKAMTTVYIVGTNGELF